MGQTEALDRQKRETARDWLTGLVPVAVIAVYFYHWQAVTLMLLAVAGYVAAAALVMWLCKRSQTDDSAPAFAADSVAAGAVTGLLCAFCLPATAPLWLAAVMGAVAALVGEMPGRVGNRAQHGSDRPLPLRPMIIGYLAVRLVFAPYFSVYTMPPQWCTVDGLTAATPLAALAGDPADYTCWELLLGIRAGSIGEGCLPAIILSAGYLALRKRLRLIVPATFCATVVLLSWCVWDSPLYGLLAGSTALAALLIADRTYAPEHPADQAAIGLLAGGITVWIRAAGASAEGTATALLIADLFTPAMPIARGAVCRAARWVWPYLRRFLCFAGKGVVCGARFVGRMIVRLFRLISPYIRRFCEKIGRAAGAFLRRVTTFFKNKR